MYWWLLGDKSSTTSDTSDFDAKITSGCFLRSLGAISRIHFPLESVRGTPHLSALELKSRQGGTAPRTKDSVLLKPALKFRWTLIIVTPEYQL